MFPLGTAGECDPFLLLKESGHECFDTQAERLGGRVPEHFFGRRVPKDDALSCRVCDNDCVGHPLEEVADAQLLQAYCGTVSRRRRRRAVFGCASFSNLQTSLLLSSRSAVLTG